MTDIRRQVMGYQPGQAVIFGGFDFNGSDDPTTTYGKGFTVEHTSTGVWTVTLTVPVSSFVSIVPVIAYSSTDDDFRSIRVGAVDAAAKTFELVLLSSDDTSTDHPARTSLVAASGRSCFFMAVVSRSGQPGSA